MASDFPPPNLAMYREQFTRECKLVELELSKSSISRREIELLRVRLTTAYAKSRDSVNNVMDDWAFKSEIDADTRGDIAVSGAQELAMIKKVYQLTIGRIDVKSSNLSTTSTLSSSSIVAKAPTSPVHREEEVRPSPLPTTTGSLRVEVDQLFQEINERGLLLIDDTNILREYIGKIGQMHDKLIASPEAHFFTDDLKKFKFMKGMAEGVLEDLESSH